MLEDVPARHDRLAAAMLPRIVDGLKDAVKWVMEPEMLAMEIEIERRVRERVAAGLRKEAEDARRTLAVFEPQDRDTRVLARAATLDEIADRVSRGESR